MKKPTMRLIRVLGVIILLAIIGILIVRPWEEKPLPGSTIRIEPGQSSGFYWPFYLYIPENLTSEVQENLHLIIRPPNSGRVSDDIAIHEENVKRKLRYNAQRYSELNVVSLLPVFPRPESNPYLYTHALDRDVLTTDDPTLARLDLQLIAMIDVAIDTLQGRGFNPLEKVLIEGFSASGMFANRFTVLHPERILAAAVGSPGGWPIAPIAEWEGRSLRYPVGIADYVELTGREFDQRMFRQIPQFYYIGSLDSNDSVPYADGYEQPDTELIMALFGRTPVERWSVADSIYHEIGANATFRIYEGVGHTETPEMRQDVNIFFRNVLQSTDFSD